MNKALKKALSIGVILTLMLCCILANPAKGFAAYQDGSYYAAASCSGGSGRGGVTGATVVVSGGNISAVGLIMSSPNYDYCYDPVTGGQVFAPAGSGNSVFWINYPGQSFNFTANTTAMSEPHEITYTVWIDLSGIPAAGPSAEELAKQELEKKLEETDELILEIGEVSIGSRDAIAAARAAVDAFSEEEQQGLKNLAVLEEAEKVLAAIEKKIEDADALIDKIGDDIGLESESDIEAARKAVNELSEDERKELKNLSKLQSAEDIFKEIKEAAEKAAAEAARRREILSYVAAGAAVLVILAVVIFISIRKGKKQ